MKLMGRFVPQRMVPVHRVLFRIGSFEIYSYGFVLVVAFLLSLWMTVVRGRKKGYAPELVVDLCCWILAGGVIGARLLYVVLDYQGYLSHPLMILNLRQGGLSWHGALAGGALAVWLFVKKHRLPFLPLADLCSPGAVFGLGIGRLGCLLNGCCLGKVTSLPFGLEFPETSYLGRRHPAQLYEMALDLLIVATLLNWEKQRDAAAKAPPVPGEMLLLMLALYSMARFVVEFFREGALLLGALTLGQWVSLAIAILSWFLLKRRLGLSDRQAGALTGAQPSDDAAKPSDDGTESSSDSGQSTKES